jgi:hypothetical protein
MVEERYWETSAKLCTEVNLFAAVSLAATKGMRLADTEGKAGPGTRSAPVRFQIQYKCLAAVQAGSPSHPAT